MSIDWLVPALCIAFALLVHARAASLVVVADAARPGAQRSAVAGLVVLGGVHAHRGAALDRSWTRTTAGAPSTINSATPPFTEATGRSHFTWTSNLHARRDVLLRAPPPDAGDRTRSRPALATEQDGASLPSGTVARPKFRHGRRRVEVGAPRPGSRGPATLPVGARRSAWRGPAALPVDSRPPPTPPLERPGIGPGPRGATSPGGWHRESPGGGAPFRNRL
jgi:hypothetical protein